MARHNDIGRWGEDVAASFLERSGWYIRHRDWRHGHTDIDLICIDEDDTMLIFVEVKTRSTDRHGDPAEAVQADKRRNVINAAAAYKRLFRKENRMIRYDIISIIGHPDSPDPPLIRHIPGAFSLMDVFEDRKRV